MESSRGPPRVKNKAAAPVQISAEQLLREAVDRQEVPLQAPTQRFADLEELKEYQGRKRREFEDYIRRSRVSLKNWLQYTSFELEQKEFARARSVFERALDVHPNNIKLWIAYIESEIRGRNIQHARNLLDRAVTRLPRLDKLWYKYVFVEETLGNVAGTRQVFDRWMKWEPDEAAWNAYIKLEKRYGEYDRAREIFQAYTIVHPEPRTWIKWARFEEELGTSDMVREVFQTAIESLGDEFVDERLFVAYARFEAKLKDFDRARAIYKFGLDRLPRSKSMLLHKEYTVFEKQFGDKEGVEDVILSKRRRHYEELVRENPKNYDAWFDYAKLEESSRDPERIRDVYEKAVAQLPPAQEKRLWRRYIFLWVFYAVWEELEGSPERARQIWDICLGLIPHQKFTFAKVWLGKAEFELRQGNLTTARKTLGRAIGMCPQKDKLFNGYISIEKRLFEFQRCRKLYEKHVMAKPANCQVWVQWAELERGLDDVDRARGIYELGISQPTLDMPEVLWKAYIDFEEEEGEYEKTRELYERLLEKADHPKVWNSYAQFEINIPTAVAEGEEEPEEEEEDAPLSEETKARVRKIFERAHNSFKDKELKAERAYILSNWLGFEKTHGSDEDIDKIQKQMPRKTKKKRKLDDDTWEEYVDYVFPADDQQTKNLSNLLAMAQAWKKTGGTIDSGS